MLYGIRQGSPNSCRSEFLGKSNPGGRFTGARSSQSLLPHPVSNLNYFPLSESIRYAVWQVPRLTHGWQSFICAENSVSPFGITEELLVKLLQRYHIRVTFSAIILAFGQKPENSLAGMAQATFWGSGSDFGQ